MENNNNSGITIFGALTDWIMDLSGRVDKEIKIYAERMFWSVFGRYIVIGALLALGSVYAGIECESKFILLIGIAITVYLILHGWDQARRQVMLIYGFGELISQVVEINRRLEKTKEAEAAPSNYEKAEVSKQAVTNKATVPVSTDNSWVCTCGKAHPGYVSSCVCGVSKRDAMRKQ